MSKVGRNDPCPCGSGKKSKRCCGAFAGNSTPLSGHVQIKKTLKPPMLTLKNVSRMSWLEDRLPEVLWVLLILTSLERNVALDRLRRALAFVHYNQDGFKVGDFTHSGIASLEGAFIQKFLCELTEKLGLRKLIRPLLLLETLPGRQYWKEAIGEEPESQDWQALGAAVGNALDHQSQVSTDARWVKCMYLLLMGKLHPRTEEQIEQFRLYPDYGDQREVRPFIRATEGAVSSMTQSPWSATFWREVMENTDCEPLEVADPQPIEAATTAELLGGARLELVNHQKKTRTTTAVDAKHDAVFGIALYALTVVDELMRIENGTSVLGRMGLRALVEAYVSLAYLLAKNTAELWSKYRRYGSGQAKLAYLKFEKLKEVPKFVDLDTLKSLANEDVWEEFVEVELGHWANCDLRVMSEGCGTKPDYDHYYSWTSGYVHATWAAVRDTTLVNCANPLHRLHRIPRVTPRRLEDVVADAVRLTDKILELVDKAYPSFASRLSKGTSGAAT